MVLTDFLDRPIAYHRCFVNLGAGVGGAVMLSQCIYWSKRTKNADGWFYKTISEWTDETGISRHEQDSIKKKLCELGVLKTKLKGVPATLHFKVDLIALNELLTKSMDSSLLKSGKLDCGKPANQYAEIRQTITENTTENTTYIKNNATSIDIAPTPKEKELVKKGFENWWNTWRESKKLVNVSNCGAKNIAYEKFAKKFNSNYFKKQSDEDFKNEVENMCGFTEMVFNDIANNKQSEFFNFRNMYPQKFINNEMWKAASD